MHLRNVAFIGLAGSLLIASPAAAANQACCGEKMDKACCNMPCCKDPVQAPDINIVGMLSTNEPAPVTTVAPARQAVTVWFHRPVWVGKSLLQGRYVIEHDNDRMVRGEPCTHIYAYDDRKTPIVAFHCIHIERDAASKDQVTLVSTGEIAQRMVEFQFAGETGAHALPLMR
jgi:hypothetical protein